MVCPSCQHENDDTARFCNQCGTPLFVACEGCGRENPRDAGMCLDCGAGLGRGAPAPAPEVTLPADLESAERRFVTVMFSDLSGYTALNESLDPEEVEALMGKIRDAATDTVTAHGGIVNQFVGDEVMSVFGIPHAHEDDPAQAVLAALELHARVRDIAAGEGAEHRETLRLHTGINTGTVLSRRKEDAHGRYGLIGDPVNTCSRLLKEAAPDEILIGPETFQLVSPYFRTETLRPVSLKGKAQPLTPYRIMGTSDVRSRFEASERRGLTRFEERVAEMDVLNGLLEKALTGRGQVVSVRGETGVGKSRLLHEFLHRIPPGQVTTLVGRCQAHGHTIPYHPLIDAMHSEFGISETDSAEARLEKTAASVRRVDPVLEVFLPHYLHLLSVPSEAHPLPRNLNGVELSIALQTALMKLVEHCCRASPLVILLEDWHWADEASEAVMRNLQILSAKLPLLIAYTYRLDFRQEWLETGNHTYLDMAPMDLAHCEAMMQAVLKAREIPEGLVELIQEQTGGNPYYIEELCGALKEEGALAVEGEAVVLRGDLEALRLPSSLQGVIRERLDRLSGETRKFLSRAAVIGREFSAQLIRKIAGSLGRVEDYIEELVSLDLIQHVGGTRDLALRFKHVLTQEVAYDSMLREERRELHGLVGRVIESQFADRLEEHAEALAHHYGRARQWEPAVRFARLSGEKAYAVSQFQTAAEHFERAAKWVREWPDTPERGRELVDVLLRACWCYLNLGSMPKIVAVCDELEPVARALNDAEQMRRLRLAYGTAYMYMGDLASCERHLRPGIEEAREQGDDLGFVGLSHLLGGCYLGQGMWKDADPILTTVLPIYEKHALEEEYLFDIYILPYPIGCSQLGYARSVQGRVRESDALFSGAIRHADSQTANLTTRMNHMLWMSLHCANTREDKLDAHTRGEALLAITESSEAAFIRLGAAVIRSNLLLAREDFQGVRDVSGAALQAVDPLGIRTGHVANLVANFTLACLELGAVEAARTRFEQSRELSSVSPHWYGPRFDCLEARLLAAGGDAQGEQVAGLFRRSMRRDQAVGAVALAAMTEYEQARVLAAGGDDHGAREALERLSDVFAGMGLPVWRDKCRAALSGLRPE